MAAASIWTRLSLVVVIAVPWMFTLPSGSFGVRSSSLAGLGALIGAFVGYSYRDRDFLKLPGASRRKVIAVRRSGELTGDRVLDGLAFNRAQRVARTAGLDRILLAVVITIYVASPVVAAVRDDGWWLLCLLPGAVAAAALPATWPPEDTRVQWDRLRHPVGPPSAAAPGGRHAAWRQVSVVPDRRAWQCRSGGGWYLIRVEHRERQLVGSPDTGRCGRATGIL